MVEVRAQGGAVELMANLVLFVPPALLFGVALRRPLLVLVGAGATSALIEVLQAFATVLGRSCSTNDWLYNTLGAALGAAIAVAVLRGAGSDASPRHSQSGSGLGRGAIRPPPHAAHRSREPEDLVT